MRGLKAEQYPGVKVGSVLLSSNRWSTLPSAPTSCPHRLSSSFHCVPVPRELPPSLPDTAPYPEEL